MGFLDRLLALKPPGPPPLEQQAMAYAPRGKFQVYEGPLHGQWIDYTGEFFRADESGPVAVAFTDHHYELKCDEYSDRLYYIWMRRKEACKGSSVRPT